MINTITFWIWFVIWPIWFIWEMVLLYLRSRSPGASKPALISMVARDMGWRYNSAVYTWSGLAAHFWWPGPDWAPVVTGLVFWSITLLLVIEDVTLQFIKPDRTQWPTWLRYQRLPLLWMVLGFFAGHFLFAQHDSFFDILFP
jgi:hypothetical protein